jgi:hypothetical protein
MRRVFVWLVGWWFAEIGGSDDDDDGGGRTQKHGKK